MKSHPKLLGLSLCSCRPAVASQRHQQLQQEGQQASSSSCSSPRRRCRSPPRWTCQSSCQRRPARSLRGRRACCSTSRARPPAARARGAAALFDVAPASSKTSGGVHRVADKAVKTVAKDWNWMLTRKIEKADTFSLSWSLLISANASSFYLKIYWEGFKLPSISYCNNP